MLAVSSSLTPIAPHAAPLPSSPPGTLVPAGLVEALSRVPDPRDPRGVRYRLATLLALGVCAMTSLGHNSPTAIAEWARRCDQAVLARLCCPCDPFTGRFTAPGERTLRDVFGTVDAAALAQAGFARLTALTPSSLCATAPDGVREREQRRAHRTAAPQRGDVRPSRQAFAVDGTRAARSDGAPIYMILYNLSAAKGVDVRRWAKKDKVELCFTPTSASWANPIEAHFGPLRQFTANSNHPVQTRALHACLRWRNAHAHHRDVLAAERKECSRMGSERGVRWADAPSKPQSDPTRLRALSTGSVGQRR